MNEEFVPFELSKKLKEKGFRYNKNNLLNRLCMENQINHPPISQVLKWLREEKDIFIELEYINQEAYGCTIIIQKTGGLIANWNWDKFQYANKNPLVGNTYEKAALAGIDYCLDNLI